MTDAAPIVAYKDVHATGKTHEGGLNGGWSPIFFKWQKVGWAFMWILLLDAAVAATSWKFMQVNRTAGYLFLPYMGWCMFATLLNYSIWLLNYDSDKKEE